MTPVSADRLPALIREAQEHMAGGRLPQARRALETVVANKPDLAVAHYNLAKVLLKLEEPELALQHLDRAADLKPDEVVVWKQYATALQWLGEPERTTAFLNKAKRARLDRGLLMSLQEMLKPGPGRSRTSIGTAPAEQVQQAITHLREGRAAEAAKMAEALDRAHPNVAILADLLAYAQSELGLVEEAERNFRRAIKLDPNYAEARANFGQFLLRQERYDEAIDELREALRLNPKMPVALTSLGTAFYRKGRISRAVQFLKQSLALDPSSAATRMELADCLLAEFKPEEALEVVEPIQDVPVPNAKNRVLRARALAELGRFDEAAAIYDAALETVASKTLALTAKATMLQTLGQFDAAEALLRQAIEAEPLLGKLYSTLVVSKKLAADDPLIGQMQKLYDDPAVTADDRMHLGFALAKAMEDTKAYDRVFHYLKPANDRMREKYPYDIDEHREATRAGLDLFRDWDFEAATQGAASDFAPIFVTGLPRSGTTLVEQIIASHSKVTGGGELSYAFDELNRLLIDLEKRDEKTFDVTPEQLAEVGRKIESRMRAAFPDAGRITDKGLSSHEMIGPIRAVFPKSRIIVVHRDPRDVTLSMYKNQFQEGRHLYTNSLSDLAVFYHCFTEILDFWRKKAPGAFYEISYEALIAEPESEARKLIAACDLEWEEQCLNFHENKRKVSTLSVHQVRQPLYSSSMKAWERYADHLGELFDGLGPEFDPRVSAG